MNLLITVNNYFHDFAAALLVTSAYAVFVLARTAEKRGEVESLRYFVNVYSRLTFLGRVSLGWIILAGVVRLYNFNQFEWVQAVGQDQVPALIAKHILFFTIVGAGVYYWRKLSRKVRELQELVRAADLV